MTMRTRSDRARYGSLRKFGNAWSAHTLWLLGDEPEALARLNAPSSWRDTWITSTARRWRTRTALLHQMRGDTVRLTACAEDAAAVRTLRVRTTATGRTS